MSSHSYDTILGRCIDSLRNCKELSVKYLDDNSEMSTIIQNLAKEYNEVNFEKEKADKALSKLKDDLNDAQNIELDIEALHKKYMEEDSSQLVHTQTDLWKEIFTGQDIQEVLPKNDRLSDAAFDRVDDSLLCSNVFEPPIDPISKVVIREPYKSKACGHYFEYETILAYIKERKGKAKCPYMGCANSNFKVEHLKPDQRMKQQIEQYLQSHDDTEDFTEEE